MTIKVGDKLPDGKLSESTEFDEAAGCPMPPHDVNVADALKGKNLKLLWGGVAIAGAGLSMMIVGSDTSAQITRGGVGLFHRVRF